VNDKVGYTMLTDEFKTNFAQEYFDWIDACVFAPLFTGAPAPDALFDSERDKP
jgi:hypothetical protein